MKKILLLAMLAVSIGSAAQSLLYPKHFDLQQVTLLDGPMKTAMMKNIDVLLQYDVDRLLTPYVRQAGLAQTTDEASPYYQWATRHPNFTNWGDSSFDLSGHVGGHYLSALAMAYAACHDADLQARLKERMDYMLQVMKDCQDQYDENTQGLYGFIGGQPINSDWTALYGGNIQPYKAHGGWVPLYVEHKILAGLRDAYVYGQSEVARELFRKLADWSVNVVAKLSDANMQSVLDTEHGGMNESMLDAYQLFGDQKYLDAAKKYTHRTMLQGMQTLSTTFLDGKHANTQVPKYIGMERIGEEDATATNYLKAAENFWQDVATNRTVCIGGNSVNEHFLARQNANRYIDQLDGPESCNTNNMLKLSEMMSDRTADARYADFYEAATWNHILSTQDPETGGYVYFTTLRPQGYRIYSQVNQGMWCCVGTGMENHSKYGHFIYTHDGSKTLYVNLFTPSRLAADDFVVTQETDFPNAQQTRLTIGKAGTYTIAIRHPQWAGPAYQLSVNGSVLDGSAVEPGTPSYIEISRTWAVGDVVTVQLPMQLRYEVCPGYEDYIAFKYGPILLGARTTHGDEQLQNEYAGTGRMDHAPGSRATSKNLTDAPLLIGERSDVLARIVNMNEVADPLPDADPKLEFTIDASRPGISTYKWQEPLTLEPFYQIHHDRYMCYWYQQTAENYANSSMAQSEAEREALAQRTLDFVAPGEQQSEAGHEYDYSSDSSTGLYNSERYRDARANGYIQYTLYNNSGVEENLSIMLRFQLADRGRRATLTIDGVQIADITIPNAFKGSDANGFFNVEYPIPADLAKGKDKFVVRLTASSTTLCPGIYYVRLMKDYNPAANAYRFVPSEWTTGDAGRVSASNVIADDAEGTLTVRASGMNNVCLMLRWQDTDYTIDSAQKYLVVRGTGLDVSAGNRSYLWWLNGSNHGTQVAPEVSKTVAMGDEEQQLVAWNMATSGIYENFTGNRPNVCMGQTIFGLTSASGTAVIRDINFVASPEEYISHATGINSARTGTSSSVGKSYDLQGRRFLPARHGIAVSKGQKVVK